MAEIFVDGRILDPMMDSRRSLRSAYAELQQATVLQGRLIAQVKLDHEDIGWNDPKIDWDEPLSNFQVFSIRTVSPTVLAEQVLTSMIQAAHPASSIHRQVADLYRSPNTVDAKQRLAHIINWWQQQLDGLSQLRNLDRLIRKSNRRPRPSSTHTTAPGDNCQPSLNQSLRVFVVDWLIWLKCLTPTIPFSSPIRLSLNSHPFATTMSPNSKRPR